jgi:UDP-N-acetylglucosamine 2-epimerase (non-hydrolysing)
VLPALLAALAEVSRDCPLVLPAHPRTAGRLRDAGLPGTITVIPPAGYLDFIALEASARLVLTDSGGVQEETTVLGVPCLTLRDSTERPITVTEGTNQLVGRDPERIVKAASEVLATPPTSPRIPALWDGKAGRRIAAVLIGTHDGLFARANSLQKRQNIQGHQRPADELFPEGAIQAITLPRRARHSRCKYLYREST